MTAETLGSLLGVAGAVLFFVAMFLLVQHIPEDEGDE